MNKVLSYAPLLEQGLSELGIETSSAPLLQYLSLLTKWNRAYNLTAIRDMDAMISRHLLDSLAINRLIHGQRLLDVGSGAGLPGIPLALIHPELEVVLLDSNGKKTRFLQEAKRQLGLDNIEIVQTRVENYHPSTQFDTLVSRAFSSLAQILTWTQHLVAPQGVWLAMKGCYPKTELEMINLPYQVETYTVPNLDSERCCVVINNGAPIIAKHLSS